MGKPKLKVSSTVLPFREKAESVWKLERYQYPRDKNRDVVFFGMYHIGDFLSFIKHRGRKIIFWTGGDVLNLRRGYLFSDGKQEWLSKIFSWIPIYLLFRTAENYCENEVERKELADLGIYSEIAQSFLEDIDDFQPCFKTNDERRHVYLSVRQGQEKEYGQELVEEIASRVPDVVFHIYGGKLDVSEPFNMVVRDNIIYHGSVPQNIFNGDIRNYHCGLRCNEHDGFSEITAKSILLGQYPISRIRYQMVDNYQTKDELIALLKGLKNKTEPNISVRNYWRFKLNDLPFLKN